MPEDIVEDQIQKMLKGISTELEYSNPQKNTEIVRTCPCCFNSFSGNNLNNLCNQIVDNLKSKNIDFKRSVFVRVLIAPVLDTARITVRTIVSKSNEKTFAFPTMCELTTRLVVENLKVQGLCIANDASEADFQVRIRYRR